MRQVGAYLLESLRGKGGMGSVYLGRHVHNGQPVAVKLLELSASQRQRLRFQREGRTLARLRHPGLVRVLGAGLSDSGLWLAMERLDGESLEERLRRAGPLRPAEVRDLGLALTDALGAAHSEGVLHRDLKPDNVLMTERGPVVIDFGLAKDLEVKESIRLSQTGRLAGTPGYWAPEQARGEVRDAGPTTDVYGLGATLYAALSGGPPFQAPTLMEAVVATQTCPPPPLSGCPPRLEALLSRCLAKEPAQRPPSMQLLAHELRGLDLEAGTGWAAKVGALVVLGLVAGLGFLAGAPPSVRSELVNVPPSARPSAPPSASDSPTPRSTAERISPASGPPLASSLPAGQATPRSPAQVEDSWLEVELQALAAPEPAERRAALLRVGRRLLATGRTGFEGGQASAPLASVGRLYERAQRTARSILAESPDPEVYLALARATHGRAHMAALVPERSLAARLLHRSLSAYREAAPGLHGSALDECHQEWAEVVYLLAIELNEGLDPAQEFKPALTAIEAWSGQRDLPRAQAALAQVLTVLANDTKDQERARDATRSYQRAIRGLAPGQHELRARWVYCLAHQLLAQPTSDRPRALHLLKQLAADAHAQPRLRLLALGKLAAFAPTREEALAWAQRAEAFLLADLAGLAGWGQAVLSGFVRADAIERAAELTELVVNAGALTPIRRSIWLSQIAYGYIRRRGDIKQAEAFAERAAAAHPQLENRLLQAHLAALELDPKRSLELLQAPYDEGTVTTRLKRERDAMNLAVLALETLLSQGSRRKVLSLVTRAQKMGSSLADQVFVMLGLSTNRPIRYSRWTPQVSDLTDKEFHHLAKQCIPAAARLAKRRRGYFHQQARSWQAQLAVGLWPTCTRAELAGAYEILKRYHVRLPDSLRALFLDDMVRLCSLLAREGGDALWFERGREALDQWPSGSEPVRRRREAQLLLARGKIQRARQLVERALAGDLDPLLRDQFRVQRSLILLEEGESAAVRSAAPEGAIGNLQAFQLVSCAMVACLGERDLAGARALYARLESARCGVDFHTLVTFVRCQVALLHAAGEEPAALRAANRGLALVREETLRADLLTKRGAIRLALAPPQRGAIEDLAEAVRLTPRSARAHSALVRGALRLGDRERARAELERARAVGLDNPKLRELEAELGR